MKTKLKQLTGTNICNSKFADYQTTDVPKPVNGLHYTYAGPFTNIFLSDSFVLDNLLNMPKPEKKSSVVVIDYSSPNASKELHVGHLRSTLVGDCIANVLAKLGYDVIKQNHIGDKNFTEHISEAESLEKIHEIYADLNIGLTPADIKSESSFDGDDILHLLPVCLASDNHKYIIVDHKEVVLKKQNGDDTYFLTDLAALHYRLTELGADQVIYVTDFRQKDHFKALFEAAVELGWAETAQLVHVTTGCVLGLDGKPLKTRDGNSPLLKELIAEAVATTSDEAIGVGVLKYSEYAVNKQSDYVFDLEKATATKGNTSAYIQYTAARINSLLEACGHGGTVTFKSDVELALAKQLLKWVDVLDGFEAGYKPSDVTTYLYGLAKAFNLFYETGGVIVGAENEAMKVLLCAKALGIFKTGLNLLGITILEKM